MYQILDKNPEKNSEVQIFVRIEMLVRLKCFSEGTKCFQNYKFLSEFFCQIFFFAKIKMYLLMNKILNDKCLSQLKNICLKKSICLQLNINI